MLYNRGKLGEGYGLEYHFTSYPSDCCFSRWSRLDKRFDNIDKRFDNISTELKDIGKDITDLKVQVGKLETRVEERTLKVVHVQGNGTDGKNNGI